MKTEFIDGPHGRLAFEAIDGEGPVVVWFCGFRSDMTGGKASRLADWATRRGRSFLRFDYSGHGASDGVFEDGCISDWAADARAVLDARACRPQIFVGSSMGAWIASLCLRERPEAVHAFVGVAPAPDFTEALMAPALPKGLLRALKTDGRAALPSAYDEEPTIITRRLFEDGRRNLVLPAGVPFHGPVRILQGMKDPDVPWRHAVRFAEAFAGDDVSVVLIKDGDHRLSRAADLDRLEAMIDAL